MLQQPQQVLIWRDGFWWVARELGGSNDLAPGLGCMAMGNSTAQAAVLQWAAMLGNVFTVKTHSVAGAKFVRLTGKPSMAPLPASNWPPASTRWAPLGH